MLDRILGVFKLNVNTFEEIEADKNATTQAAIIVVVVALLGLGGGLLSSLFTQQLNLGSLIGSMFWTLAGWVIWAVVTWFVGTRFFGGQATIDEMLRVIGFAYAPQVLMIIPCIGPIVGWVWSLIAAFIGIRQGLDVDNTKTFFTILVGLLVFVVGGLIFGTFQAGLGFLTNR